MRRSYGIELHYTVEVGRRLRIVHQNGVAIHHHARIGNDVLIGPNTVVRGRAARLQRAAVARAYA